MIMSDSYNFGNNGTGYPELSFHGLKPWEIDESSPTLTFAYMYAEDHVEYGTECDVFIYVCVNAHWEEHTYYLPVVPENFTWRLLLEGNGFISDSEDGELREDQNKIVLGPRTSAILIAKR